MCTNLTLMRKHKYDPALVERILADDDYVLHLFVFHYAKTHDKLFLPKRRKNGDYTMKCILHHERTPSFRYSSKKKIFKCFGCGHGGNILTLIGKYYNFTFVEAVAFALKMKSKPKEIDSHDESKVHTNQLSFVFPPEGKKNDNLDLPF